MPHQLYSINKARIDKAFTLENGLTSIAAPTGSGKTHAVAECIAKALMEKKRTKKKLFLYVTPSKVNRNEFRNQLFSLLPARSEARKRILVVESNVDVSESAIKSFDKSGFSFPTSLTEGRNAVETLMTHIRVLSEALKISIQSTGRPVPIKSRTMPSNWCRMPIPISARWSRRRSEAKRRSGTKTGAGIWTHVNTWKPSAGNVGVGLRISGC